MTLPAEEDGTYTSSERRVQHMDCPLRAPGEAKPAWLVFADIAARAKPGNTAPSFLASAVRARIVAEVPAFGSVTASALANEGSLLSRKFEKGERGTLSRTISDV